MFVECLSVIKCEAPSMFVICLSVIKCEAISSCNCRILSVIIQCEARL